MMRPQWGVGAGVSHRDRLLSATAGSLGLRRADSYILQNDMSRVLNTAILNNGML